DDRVVDDAVDGRGGGHRVLEDLIPLAEEEVGGDQDRAALVALGQEGEEHLHLLPALLDVADVVQDEALEAIELLQFSGQPKVSLGGQQTLHQLEGWREQDRSSTPGQLLAQRAHEVRLARSWVAEEKNVGGCIEERAVPQRGERGSRLCRQ